MRVRRRLSAVVYAVLVAGRVAFASPPTSAAAAPPPAPTAALEHALGEQDIPAALAAYDQIAASAGPSLAALEKIARADLGFCLKEGVGWDRFVAARILMEAGDPDGRAAMNQYLKSETANFRSSAAEALAGADAADAAPAIEAAAQSPRAAPFERISMAKALFRLGRKAPAVDLVLPFAAAETAGIRGQAIAALVEFHDPATLAALKGRLDDGVESTALLAAQGLARLGDPAGKARLQRGLVSTSLQNRILAALRLSLVGDRSGFDTVRDLVQSGLAKYPKTFGLGYDLPYAVYILSWIDPVAARPYLDTVLSKSDWIDGRLAAASRLVETGDPTALSVLGQLFTDVATATKMDAYRATVMRLAIGVPPQKGLTELALRGAALSDPPTRLAALEILSGEGVEEGLGLARGFLGGASLLQRARAAEAVLRFGTPRSPETEPQPPGETPGGVGGGG